MLRRASLMIAAGAAALTGVLAPVPTETATAGPGTCVAFASPPTSAGPSLVSGTGEVHGCTGNVFVEVLVKQDNPGLPDNEIARASDTFTQGTVTATGPCPRLPGSGLFPFYTEVRINGVNQTQSHRVQSPQVGCRNF